MSKILALDTSSDNCSVALLHDSALAFECQLAPRSHTQLVLPMVTAVLSEQGLAIGDLDAIAFGCGPGSFTGIRIAAGVAQGLAYGASCPVYAVSNIQALALQSYLEHRQQYVLVAIDARMNEVYWALCRVSEQADSCETAAYTVELIGQESVDAPESLTISEELASESLAGIGSGFDYIERFPQALRSQLISYDATQRPKADTIVELAKNALAQGLLGDIKDAIPAYVRNTVTWKKLPGRE